MPKKKEYDDELVQLLGRAELPNRQIAKRLGISASLVDRIVRGEERLDLQPRIFAAMRKTLKEVWKNGGWLAGESGEPRPTRARAVPFDPFLAVELIACGQFSLSQMGKRLGLHKMTVWRIATGRSHPELQPLIREAQQHYRDQTRRLGTKWCVQIMTKQIKVGLEDNGWVGLRARQDLLDRFLGPEHDSDRHANPADRPGLADLPEPLKTEVIRALGGPVEEDEDYTHWVAPPPSAEQKQTNVAQPPSAEQEQRTPQPGAAALQAGMRRTPRPLVAGSP